MTTATPRYFETRFAADPRRRVLWSTLYRHYFQQFIAPDACVVDLGCGYGDFINSVTARRRIAIDRRADLAGHLDEGVECHIGSVADLSFLQDASVDVVLASNVFEHLSRKTLRAVLREVRRVLTPTGTLFVVQPNFYYAYRHYYDDYTHVAAYTHVSLCDFLMACDYDILQCEPRFLPLTIKSRMPVSPVLIRMYLALPWKPMAGQMLVRCRPAENGRGDSRRDGNGSGSGKHKGIENSVGSVTGNGAGRGAGKGNAHDAMPER